MSRWARAARAARIGVACAVVSAGSACAGKPRANVTPASPPAQFVGVELIGELKDFGQSLGGQATENFLRHTDRQTADNRCYFTGRLQLPEFYSTLRMVREDGDRCAARSDEYDVFFYPVEAVASGEEAITVSLAETPTGRVLVVVPHEDFHNQPEARKAPTEVAEAAATLDLYRLLGSDTAALVSAMRRLLTDWPIAAVDAEALMKADAR